MASRSNRLKWKLLNTALFGAASLASTSPIWAEDGVELKTGGKIAASSKVLTDEKTHTVSISLRNGGELVLDRKAISKIHEETDAEREYAEKLKTLDGKLESHLALAEWCKEKNLRTQAALHFRNVLEIDSENQRARQALGYAKFNGNWLTREEQLRRQGKRSDGTLLEEQAVASAKKEFAEKSGDLKSELNRGRRLLGKAKHDDGVAILKSITDPAAVPLVREFIQEEKSAEIRRLWVEVLLNIDKPAIVPALVDVALRDDNDTNRDLALRGIEKFRDEDTQKYFLAQLGLSPKGSLDIVDRAGVALVRFGDQSSIRSLIQALVQTRLEDNPNASKPGEIGATFGSGGTGFNTGNGQPKHLQVKHNFAGVLEALKKHSGVDYGFDQNMWLNWYTDAKTPKGKFDLRRNE